MASREELSLFRAARTGQAQAQIALGRYYLFGGSSLPQSLETGLYWLARAARQGSIEACMLIGANVPYETAQRVPGREELSIWYARAFEEGVMHAGLVLARLVLAAERDRVPAALRDKAWRALETVAEFGIPEAQWILAQQIEKAEASEGAIGAAECGAGVAVPDQQGYLEWARRAASNGVLAAQRRLADYAWDVSDDSMFLRWAVPIAQSLTKRMKSSNSRGAPLTREDRQLLSRCAQALFRTRDFTGNTIREFSEPAARAGDRQAQLYLGLWLAKMDKTGRRISGISSMINYRLAIQWLTSAGQQGLADAWYVISRIYLKAEFAHRSVTEAERYLDYAAQGGHRDAQLELGKRRWRKRRSDTSNDVIAAYWLQRASAQGCTEAGRLLNKIASHAEPAIWARSVQCEFLSMEDPLLAARITLAAHFGLSKQEALALDVRAADNGHCLLIDIRDQSIRAKRRLILIRSGDERRMLDYVKSMFERMTCDSIGVEGSYRQRLYHLEAVLASNQAIRPLMRIERNEFKPLRLHHRANALRT